MKLTALLAVPIAAFGAGIVYASSASAIADGDVVPQGRYRFSVQLTMTGIPTPDGGRRDSACSGALVAPQWVITAGHCFRDANDVRVEHPVADVTTATVGRADMSTTAGQTARVVAVRQSPTNDMALARLDVPVLGIRPLEISDRAPAGGDELRLTGFGSTTSSDPVPSTLLRTGQFTVTSVADSTILVTGFAPRRDTTPCPFDSGAPYFVESRFSAPRLVSVVSNGPSCPHTQEETASRVDNMRDWIDPIIRG